MIAYRELDEWVRKWSIPEPDQLAPTLPKSHAVCVTLRFAGKVIGRGQAIADPSIAILGGNALILRTAAVDAMQQAGQRLPINPNNPERSVSEQFRLFAQEITVSLELAGPLTPMEHETWALAELGLLPGLDGVCLTTPSSTVHPISERYAVFPSQMLLTNTLPHRALGGLIATTLGEGGAAAALDEPKVIRDRHGLRFSSFRCVHLAQPAPGREPVFLFRGQRLVPPLSHADLRLMADNLAAHLIKRAPSAPPEQCDPLQTALAAYALTRYASLGPDARHTLAARDAIERLKEKFGAVSGHDSDNQRHTLLTAQALAQRTFAQRGDIAATQGIHALPSTLVSERASAMPAPLRSLYLHAYIGAISAPPVKPTADQLGTVSNLLLTTWTSVPAEQRVSLLPWFVWAADELKQVDPGSTLEFATPLRELRTLVWKHQLSLSDTGPDAQDCIGGVLLTKGITQGQGAALPTWQCVRPIAALATMLRQRPVTDLNERPLELARLMSAMRFFRQLQVDETSVWLYTDFSKGDVGGLGGVRASSWDSSQPIDATSLTLLATVELLHSLNDLATPTVEPQPLPLAPTP